jgi:DNA-binding LacI/PurR family transcriptional regulator
MATLKDVAELAGVSVGTASMALNQGEVKESTRQRVLECAKRLNYIPNRIGRTLNTGKSNAIALLMMTSVKYADIVHKTSLFYYLQQGVLAVVDQANYSLRLDVKAHEDPDLLDYFERVIGDRTLDGIIIVPQYRRDYPFIYPLRQRSFPYVMMRPACFGTDVNYVDLDNYHGGQLVAQRFAQRGCRRVAMINGPETHVDAIERERGFFEGLVAVGVKKVTKRYGDFTIPSGTAAMESVLKEFTPDAVFCANDYMAAGAMKVLRGRGLLVPGDVAVVGYDNTDLCLALDPTLTTVDYRAAEVGRCLASELLALITGKARSVGMVIRPFLVERESHERVKGPPRASNFPASVPVPEARARRLSAAS